MSQSTNTKAKAWSLYWKSGRQDTCFVGDEAFDLSQVWSDFFSTLSPHDAVLDLATGNGAVAWIAQSVSDESGLALDITGVDQADIEPNDTFNMVGNTFIESLPFEDNRFDALVSQFGFEYAEVSDACKEVLRVLKPEGRIHFIMHSKDGAVEESTRKRLNRLSAITGKGGPLDLAKSISEAATVRQQGNKVSKGLQQFQSKHKTLARRFGSAPPDDVAVYALRYLSEFVSNAHRHDPQDARHLLNNLAHELKAYNIRLNSMLKAARSARDMQALTSRLTHSGLSEVNVEPISEGDRQIAWLLTGQAG